MSTLQDKQAVQTAWRLLLQEWEELDDDDPPSWRKGCGMLTFFITQTDEGFFEFAAHSGDDVVIIKSQKLDAVNLGEAMDESDDLISEFVDLGASVMKTDEIRIKQAFACGSTVMGVGEDGKLYRFDGPEWSSSPMKLRLKS